MTAATSTRLTCDVITRHENGFTVICGYQYDGDGTATRARGIAAAEGWTVVYSRAGQAVEDRCPLHSPDYAKPEALRAPGTAA